MSHSSLYSFDKVYVRTWIQKTLYISYNVGGPTLEVRGLMGSQGGAEITNRTNILNADTQKDYILEKIEEMGQFFEISSHNIESMQSAFLNRKGYFAMTDITVPYYFIRCSGKTVLFLNATGDIFDLHDWFPKNMDSLIQLKEKIIERIAVDPLLDKEPQSLPACKKALEIIEAKITMTLEKKELEETLPKNLNSVINNTQTKI